MYLCKLYYETKVKDKSNHNLENVAENILSIRAISQTVENPSSSSIYMVEIPTSVLMY